jgi:hypothetical protein
MGDHLGYFLYDDDNDTGIICLLDSLERNLIIDTFVEEWAHARTAFLCDADDTAEDPWHHPSFWSEYGRITKASREVAW